MSALNDENTAAAVAAAVPRLITLVERFSAPGASWDGEHYPGMGNDYLQHLLIDLDALRLAIEQRLHEVGTHEPTEFGA